MKNYVKTKAGLSEKDEAVCVGIFRNVMRVRHLLGSKSSKVAESIGLHAAETNVVDILGNFGPISMGQLSTEAFISPSNATNTVKKARTGGAGRETAISIF